MQKRVERNTRMLPTRGSWDVKLCTGSVNFFKVLGLTPPKKDMSNRKRKFPKKKYLQIVIKNKIFERFLLNLELNMTITSIYEAFL